MRHLDRLRNSLVISMLVLVAAAPTFPAPAVAAAPRNLPGPADASVRADDKERIKRICELNGLKVIEHVTAQCTHGEDPAPPGKNIRTDVKPVATTAAGDSEPAAEGKVAPGAPTFICDGDGVSGYRTQVVYVHASDRPNRYNTYKASFLQWAWEADQIYRASAQDTGGLRRIRFVQEAGCAPTVLNVTLSANGDDSLTNTINQLTEAGYSRSDRKYLIFADANVMCGVGTMMIDDRPGQENWNNYGPDYARIDAGCWSGDIAAHEHMHNMGGVQNSAPHASGGNHCTDEYDVMCYSDAPNYPLVQVLCSTSSRNWNRFDCNYDDYFNVNPAGGSYLATRWNTANNRFLASDNGSPAPPPCPDQAQEPDESYPAARSIAVGATTSRAFCAAGDQDWTSFQTVANKRYRVQVPSHAAGITPAVEVLAGNGKKVLAADTPSAGGLASVDFRTRTGGAHYVRVTNSPASFTPGPDKVYELKVLPIAQEGSGVGGFGYNGYHQIGGVPFIYDPNPRMAFNASAVQVSAGYLHSGAVMNDGTVRTWGWNMYGALGNGTLLESATQVNPGLTNVVSVTSGLLHTLAVKADGSVWAWGWNGGGQLGDGTYLDRSTPVKVHGLTDVVEVAAGYAHSLALKRDGTVWGWGYNGASSIGDGTTYSRTIPVKLPLSNVTSIASGALHGLATLENGTVKGWGANDVGQVGDGTRTTRSAPVTVSGAGNAYRVTAGWAHSAVLKNDGSVWAWGWNTNQQAGGGVSADRVWPAAVSCSGDAGCPKLGAGSAMGKIDWISAGGLHTLALAEDGTVWTWGWNGIGQLGNGSLLDSGTAVRAGLTASDVSGGFYHSSFRS